MRFVYGTFNGVASDNWACTGAQKVGVYENGGLTSILATLDFQAVLHAADQYALSTRAAAIQSGILYNGKNVGFLHSNGTPSRLYLDSSQSQSGVRITRFPFPEPNIAGADYVTSLMLRCSFEAEYSAPNINPGGAPSPNVLVSYAESFSVTGDGGPRTAIQEYIKGAPEQFVLADQTAVYATQRGAAAVEGFNKSFSQVSAPLFPDLLEHDSKGETRTITRLTDGKWNCAIEWEYRFKSISQIDGAALFAPSV